MTGTIDEVGVYMFALVFFWTPPHFWTLSVLLKDDYSAAKVPMLASVASPRATTAQIVLYIVLLIAMAWLPYVSGYGGVTFGVVGTLLGAQWLHKSRVLCGEPTYAQTLSAYKYSLV